LLNDTIGFIRELPPKLIKSFSSTLEDSIEADFLLHVIDSSDTFIQERIDVVNEILDKIGALQKRILVFNKIDLISPERLAELQKRFGKEHLRISVKEGKGLEEVKQKIREEI
jgi:GTP-binding protein HflX